MFKNLATKTALFLRPWPNRVFVFVVLLFVVETGYVAATNSYPMAYDEIYHVGMIQHFADNLNPFSTAQSPATYYLGNTANNPSWLYHWLLSFPYRLLALSGSQYVEIVTLRLLNVGMLVASFFVLRSIARKLGLPAWAGVTAVALFALTPVVGALAAQINYDNLLILATLLGTSFVIDLIRQAKTGSVKLATLSGALIVLCLGSLVKYSFLPIAVVLFGAVIWAIWVSLRRARPAFLVQFSSGTKHTSAMALLLLATGSVLLAGTYYGRNMVEYKNPVPDCAQVLTVSACSNWGSWGRNHTLELAKAADPSILGLGIKPYTEQWIKVMTTQLFGNVAPNGDYSSVNPTFVRLVGITTFLAFALALSVIIRLLRKYPYIILFLAISMMYTGMLFYRNFSENLRFGVPVAVQGRYLAPLLGLVYLSVIAGVYIWTTTRPMQLKRLTTAVASITLFAFVVWGGATHYISAILPEYTWKSATVRANVDNHDSASQIVASVRF